MLFDVAATKRRILTVRSAGGRAGTGCYHRQRTPCIRNRYGTKAKGGGVNTKRWAGYVSDVVNVTKPQASPMRSDGGRWS